MCQSSLHYTDKQHTLRLKTENRTSYYPAKVMKCDSRTLEAISIHFAGM